MSEYLLGTLDEELALPVLGTLEERSGESPGFRFPSKLLCWTPVWASGVQWIQNDVAAVRIVESLDKFTGRVIDNRTLFAGLDLEQHLKYQSGFARAGVGNDLEMFGLCGARNADNLPLIGGSEPDTVTLDFLVEAARIAENGAFEQATILHLFHPSDVAVDGVGEYQYEENQAGQQRRLKVCLEPLSCVDGQPQILVKRGVLILALRAFDYRLQALRLGGFGQRERHIAAVTLRRFAGYYILFSRQARLRAVGHTDQFVRIQFLSGEIRRHSCSQVGWKVCLAKRGHGYSDAKEHEQYGEKQHPNDGRYRIDRLMRREDDGLFTTPVHRLHVLFPPALRSLDYLLRKVNFLVFEPQHQLHRLLLCDGFAAGNFGQHVHEDELDELDFFVQNDLRWIAFLIRQSIEDGPSEPV